MSGFLIYIWSMKIVICLLLLFFIRIDSQAQSYEMQLLEHRKTYKAEFLKDENSPLTKKDLKYLQFYEIDSNYAVQAFFEKMIDTVGFDMQTHNGVLKKYFVYGKARFQLKQKECTLFIYQSQKLMTKAGFEDYLFIPFTDLTNYTETFGGGRYLDFRLKDIVNNTLIIDFNKCYNPYCVYKEGYSCPIPPKENALDLEIRAGEKNFSKNIQEN
jgi:uncharacterized protein (DUF1684 family)